MIKDFILGFLFALFILMAFICYAVVVSSARYDEAMKKFQNKNKEKI